MDKKPIQLNKGMFKDTNEEFQPQGTYQFMLNGVLESEDGEKSSLINELGTELCFDISATYQNYSLIGACLLPDNRIVLFLTNNTVSIIGIQNINCEFEELIVSECLNFQDCKPIDCIFKLHNGCDYYIYFTDSFNKYRSINLDNLSQYILDGYNIDDLNTGVSTDPNNPTLGVYGWDCSLMAISPDYNIPDIYLHNIGSGGKLKLGAYQFTFRYLDDNLNPTNWIYITNPVYIKKKTPTDLDLAYNHGGLLGAADTDGFYYENSTIELELNNVDTRYKYYQIGIIESAQGTGTISSAYITDEITIDNSTLLYKLISTDPSQGVTSTDPNNIVVPDLFVNVIKSHTQVENKLLIGNHTEKVTDWTDFQKSANDIQTEYFVFRGDNITESTINDCDYFITSFGDSTSTNKNYSVPLVCYDNKTYMRDEVYALGIVWIFKDGSESPVFHIPGRPKIGTPIDGNDTSTVLTYTLNGTNYDSQVGYDYWANDIGDTFNIDSGTDTWDTDFYVALSTGSPYQWINIDPTFPPNSGNPQWSPDNIPACENIYTDNHCFEEINIDRWKHVNTSIKCPASDLATKITEFNNDLYKHNYVVDELGIMGYYETDTLYPDVRDCDNVPIFPHDDLGNGEYRMHKIRHHLMPDARKVNIVECAITENNQDRIRDFDNALSLKPIGVRFHNIEIPAGFEDEVQGYYLVRSNRAGNKTVIDKGWMNVCDTTYGINNLDEFGKLSDDDRTIEQNKFFMTPTAKNGFDNSSDPEEFKKTPWKHGHNIVEFFSPKSSFNDPVNLGGNYYKLENTTYGKFSFNDEENDYYQREEFPGTSQPLWLSTPAATTANKYRLHMYASLLFNQLPAMYDYEDRDKYYLPYKVPIDVSEYTLYNKNLPSKIAQSFTNANDNHRQRILLTKLFNDSVEIENGSSIIGTDFCWFQKPRHTAVYNVGGQITSGTEDILPIQSNINNPTGASTGDDMDYFWVENKWIDKGQQAGPVTPTIGEQFRFVDPNIEQKFRYSPFVYYAALKNNIVPYRKLENIKYVRTTNYIIEPNKNRYAIAGGDTFISRQQLVKTYYEKVTNSAHKYGGSMLYGYVESEINSQLRHKNISEDYRVYPWDSLNDTVWTQVNELKLNKDDEVILRESAEHFYSYRLDYSKDNTDRIYPALADQFEYCDECTGKFTNTVYYSLTSFPDDIQDFYRVFKVNNSREIPSDTGEITNLFLKEERLFVHTTNNLFSFNVAPQQLKTNNDTIEVGQGEFLNTKPVKLFDNTQGYSRGGSVFKFSGVLTDLSYIWIDNISGRVYSLEKGITEISLVGMRRFFKNNSKLFLNENYRSLTGNDYPYLNTTCGKGIGFRAVYDPDRMRYILHKRDFKVVDGITPLLLPENPPYQTNQLYYNEEGYWIVGEDPNTATFVDQLDNAREYFEVKGFTISYSLLDKAWVSFHSYLPSMMYNDSNTFYSYYSNNANIIDKTWKHNKSNFTTYADAKFPFIIDYIKNDSPYTETSFDTVEYTANVFKKSEQDNKWIEIPFETFNTVYVYNNNQISNLKGIEVSNLDPYAHITYDVNISKAHKQRNYWRINRFRDMAINRLNGVEPLFTSDWNNTVYSNQFQIAGLGWIDKAINPDIIDINKNPYNQQRFTDKFFGVRLSYQPAGNNKIVMNLLTNLKRNKL